MQWMKQRSGKAYGQSKPSTNHPLRSRQQRDNII